MSDQTETIAAGWLRQKLAAGPVQIREVTAAAERDGLTLAAVCNARDQIGAERFGSTWAMPAAPAIQASIVAPAVAPPVAALPAAVVPAPAIFRCDSAEVIFARRRQQAGHASPNPTDRHGGGIATAAEIYAYRAERVEAARQRAQAEHAT